MLLAALLYSSIAGAAYILFMRNAKLQPLLLEEIENQAALAWIRANRIEEEHVKAA